MYIGSNPGLGGSQIGPNSDIFRGGYMQPGGFTGGNPNLMGGNLIGPNNFGRPQGGMFPVGDPLLGGSQLF